MYFLGYAFCRGNHSSDTTPTNITKIQKVRIQNIIVDGFFITKNISNKSGKYIPEIKEWDFDTILNAPFEGNLLGGNVNFTADQIKSIRIKRAEIDSYNWITLFEIPITNNVDLSFTRTDFTARGNQEYKYALVPVWNENIEGNYNVNTVKSDFEGLWIVEKEMSVNALLNMKISTTQNIITSVIMPLGRKYPFVNQYGNANYTSGSFDVTFINLNTEKGEYEVDSAVKYREIIEAFITNGNPKIIKHEDGRIWLAGITESIPKDETQHYQMPIQTISFIEVGKYDSSIDLYNANIIDVNIEGEVNNNNALLSYSG